MIALALQAAAGAPTGPLTGLEHGTLALTWFGLLGVLLIGYAILDGFDLGVGIVQPFVARSDEERRLALNSIGPVWDGNEVWLVTFGGALFAAFPEAYATIFSAFYDVFFLVLLGLVLRAVSIEFRGKLVTRGWRRVWDSIFTLSSGLVAGLFGFSVGNAMEGIPLDERHEFAGGPGDLGGAFPVAAGILSVVLFALHGAIFLKLKTDGEVHRRTARLVPFLFGGFAVAFAAATVLALTHTTAMTENLDALPALWAIPALNVVAVGALGATLLAGRPGRAFVLSCASIASFVALLGLALFPYLVKGTDGNGLTVHNAASSARTLEIMLIIAAIGMPLVLTYTGIVYWTFRGKVRLDAQSY